jgi:hypothetical protein
MRPKAGPIVGREGSYLPIMKVYLTRRARRSIADLRNAEHAARIRILPNCKIMRSTAKNIDGGLRFRDFLCCHAPNVSCMCTAQLPKALASMWCHDDPGRKT